MGHIQSSRVRCHYHSALYHALKLSDISRKVVSQQVTYGCLRNACHLLLIPMRKDLKKMSDQQRQVRPPLTECRNEDRKHGQSVIEVVAKRSIPNRFAELGVG